MSGINPLYKKAKKRYPTIKIENVKKFLSKQNVYTIHKPYAKYKSGKTIAVGKDADWQIDLADMQMLRSYNKGYGYILTCIDVLSKFGWAVPIKTKSEHDVTSAFQKILESGRGKDKGILTKEKNLSSYKEIQFYMLYILK